MTGNIASVSWGDHLAFGQGQGQLATPADVRQRMCSWHDELNISIVHWRVLRKYIKGHYASASGVHHFALEATKDLDWDDLETIPRLAHDEGLQVFLYVSLFDEGWPLLPEEERQISYHNAMHFKHVSWQSDFSRHNPEYAVVDRKGTNHQWGVMCLAYSQVRAHFRKRFLRLLKEHQFDGLFVCLRSQSRPADFADQFGFNDPVRSDYNDRFGVDICHEEFDLQDWRDLLGSYITLFFKELKKDITPLGLELAVGVPRGDVLGPPMGNTTLEWRKWVSNGLIDGLIINQNSSRCPSMWHDLWSMHRGDGYLQNYLNGFNMPSLIEHVIKTYLPVFEKYPANLHVAWQWNEISADQETKTLHCSSVSGLVYSSFRYNNPELLSNNSWQFRVGINKKVKHHAN